MISLSYDRNNFLDIRHTVCHTEFMDKKNIDTEIQNVWDAYKAQKIDWNELMLKLKNIECWIRQEEK